MSDDRRLFHYRDHDENNWMWTADAALALIDVEHLAEGACVDIEVYDCVPPRAHLPTVEALAEFIEAHAAEDGCLTEGPFDLYCEAIHHPAARASLDAALAVMAALWEGGMADRHRSTETYELQFTEPDRSAWRWILVHSSWAVR